MLQNVLVAEEIRTGEVLVQRADCIKEERIAAPSSEEPIVAGFRYVRFRPRRDRRPIDDHVTSVPCPSRRSARDAADSRDLRPVSGR